MTEPLTYRKDSPVYSDVILDAELHHAGHILFCGIKYWYLIDDRTGDMLVTDVEVNTAFTPSGYQEQVMEIIRAERPGKVEFESGFKTIKQKI